MKAPLKSILLLLRPHQWLKNLFVFSPLFFSGQLMQWDSLYLAIIVFIAYSLVASSIYCFNDIRDVESDKLHPEKCRRPLASRNISITTVYFIMFVLLVLATLVIYLFLGAAKWKTVGVIGGYYLLNVAYCIKLKHIAIADVFVISTGFVLRVFAGGVATGIFVSHWIILVTFLLALFLAFAKRRDDVLTFTRTDVKVRQNINRYSMEFIDLAISIIAAVTVVCYLMYTVSAEVIAHFQTSYLYLSSIFVLAGIIRYLQLTVVDIKSGSPTKVLLKDKFIQWCIIAWIMTFFIIIYF